MPTRELLSPAQRTQFLCIPDDMSEQMLTRYYTLSDDDRSLIKQHRRNHNRLGLLTTGYNWLFQVFGESPRISRRFTKNLEDPTGCATRLETSKQ